MRPACNTNNAGLGWSNKVPPESEGKQYSDYAQVASPKIEWVQQNALLNDMVSMNPSHC